MGKDKGITSYKNISNFNSLISLYDFFIFDLCGVIHDGKFCFSEAIKIISYLKLHNKKYAFLSNSARRISYVRNFLAEKGLVLSTNDQIVTPLEHFYSYVKENKKFLVGKKIFYQGRIVDDFNNMSVEISDNIDNADYLIISLSLDSLDNNDEWKSLLKKAYMKNIPAICLNPDIVAPHGDSIIYTPGYFAEYYKALGGHVMYFGKPYQSIYNFLFHGKSIDKKRVLAIGDSLTTDIKGANDFGIDSLLVYSKGIHKNIDFEDSNIASAMFVEYGTCPTYIAKSLDLI